MLTCHPLAAAGRQIALVRSADMRRDVAQRRLALLVGSDPFAIVAHDEHRPATAASPLDHDRASVGIDRVLNKLRDRFTRVALAPGEPANQIERVGRLQPHSARIPLRSNRPNAVCTADL